MKAKEKPLTLVPPSEGKASSVFETLSTLPHTPLSEKFRDLGGVNGLALTLEDNRDFVVIEVGADVRRSIVAVKALRERLEDGAVLLAISDDLITLNDVRQLEGAGATKVLPDSISADDLREVVEALTVKERDRSGAPYHRPLGKIITVAQTRGGIGATTVAVNLANELMQETGVFKKKTTKRVALVDLDIQFGSVASFLDIEASDALHQMGAENTEPDALFLQQALTTLTSGLSVLTAPARFMPLDGLTVEQVRAVLELLQAEFDYVVVDLPHALVDWVSGVLEMTDRLMLVTDSSVPAINSAYRLINFFTEDHRDLQIDIIVSHEKKPVVLRKHHTAASKILERPLQGWLPYDPVAAREATDRGQPLARAAGRSPLARSIHKLGQTTLEALSSSTPVVKKETPHV
ncbi:MULTISPECIES: AAA family ATPase [Halocynthiibacter]|uniref:AAA family ATPase n=1 Tax=Halocynthiibacter halioticoli TaxID=2986804 RepID=A0AAE3IY73_9RHOB|nr:MULTISPECIES: AAA family ATPase [Halocynthiibacter]MCV6824437.1 AAA family ATPase [Halocynthiibacter halioticoli]MCW4057438.1 AAA family ATPase [Halocynthiibacter sp. SDUM655004]